MKDFYNYNIPEILTEFNVDIENGLTDSEVLARREKYGYNELAEVKKRTVLQMFVSQFKSFMILVLVAAAIVSGFIGIRSGEGLTDTYIILGIVILNAVIGTVQEKKAQSSLENLKKLSAPKSKVIRNGVIVPLQARDLVPGDIVEFETGDFIPADVRLVKTVNLKIQESAMTGESVPTEKHTDTINEENIALGDRSNMAFSSGIVTYGRGIGLVVKTGMETEVGKIAGMLQNTEETETPMSRRLEQLGKVLGLGVLGICAIIFVVGILYGNQWLDVLMTSISLAVAAIPEGLPAISTIVLAIGVQRMVRRNAIIRTLPSVETLGSATVICSDKTGTLTQNKMTVMSVFTINNKITDISSDNKELSSEEMKLIDTLVICNDAKITEDDAIGDPTETALLDLGLKFNIVKDELEKERERVDEYQFDSDRKLMTTVNKVNEKLIVNTKGGLDEILNCCNRIKVGDDIIALDSNHKEEILKYNVVMAEQALRVLAAAYKEIEILNEDKKSYERDLVFLGFVGMIDPARPEVKVSVEKCHTAGIRPVMITGDHKITAMAIAKDIGIMQDGDNIATGVELEKMSDEELFDNIEKYSVFARVAPEHKVRIVEAYQKHKEVVAMTGDGVNDAPALKKADIGAAMGIVGTDVAKDAADLILTDDNFATIVVAVEEGRRIYDNILKAVQFLISCNVGEVLLLFIAFILNLGAPLLPIHILWINLVTDSLPALALSMEPAEDNIMQRKPRNNKKGIFTKGMMWRISYQGLLFGLCSLAAFLIGKHDGNLISPETGIKMGQTMAFVTLTLCQLFHVRNLHSNTKSLFKTSIMYNKFLIIAILISLAMMLAVIIIPTFRSAFSLINLNSVHWYIAVGLAVIPVLFVELFKLFKINTSKDEF